MPKVRLSPKASTTASGARGGSFGWPPQAASSANRRGAAAREQLLDRLPQAVEVELPAARAPAARLLGEQLRPRHVDEIDALGHQQQVFLPGTVLAQRVEVPLDVAHRAEIDRALDAQDLELGAFDATVLD